MMKKQIVLTAALIALISSQGWAQDVKVYLADNQETNITQQQFEKLKQISTTIQHMLEDLPKESKDLYLLSIDHATFDLLMQVQDKTGDALHNELKKLSDEQIYNLMAAVNYLAAEELLDATALIAARPYFRNKHINQLLTEDGYKNYYKNLELIPDLQTKIAQQFTKLPIFLLLKKWTGQPIYEFKHGGFITFDHTGNYLFYNALPFTESDNETVRIFNLATGKEKYQFELEHSVNSVALDPTGRYLATGSDDGKARIFDLTTGEQLKQPFKHQDSINSVVFDRTGRYLATGSNDGKARIFDLTTGKEKYKFEHKYSVVSVAFDSTGRYLATGSTNNKARIYDLATGNQEPIHKFEHGDTVYSVAFDQTGRYQATDSYLITEAGTHNRNTRIFNIETGKEKYKFEHGYLVASAAFDSTGRYLAAGSKDGKARIFDLETDELKQQFEHEGYVWLVLFDPTDRYLATGSEDSIARIWIFLPTLEKALQKLTLKEAQVITLVAKKKIKPSGATTTFKRGIRKFA